MKQLKILYALILEQLKSDLGVTEINTIIGRLRDSGLGQKDWNKIRNIQQKLGEASSHSVWVNTDELNDDQKDRDGTTLNLNNLHYS